MQSYREFLSEYTINIDEKNVPVKVLFAILAAFVVVALFSVFGRETTFAENTKSASDPRAAATGSRLPASPTSMDKPKTVESAVASENLVSKLKDARDLRKFAVDAMAHPEMGGRFLAQWAGNECYLKQEAKLASINAAAVKQVEVAGTITLKQLAAQDRIKSQCASFTPQEINYFALNDRNPSITTVDPVLEGLKALKAAYATGNKDQLKAALESLLQQKAYFALTNTQTNFSAMIGANVAGRQQDRWFDGENVTSNGKMSPTQYDLAFQYAACGMDEFCGIDQEMYVYCAYQSLCESNRAEFLARRNRESGGGASSLDAIMALAERMQFAFRSGDAGAFIAK